MAPTVHVPRPKAEQQTHDGLVQDGAIVLSGPRGSGKTTLLNRVLKRSELTSSRVDINFAKFGRTGQEAGYDRIISTVVQQLRLPNSIIDESRREHRSPSQRLTWALSERVLGQVDGWLTLVFDHFDTVLNTPLGGGLMQVLRGWFYGGPRWQLRVAFTLDAVPFTSRNRLSALGRDVDLKSLSADDFDAFFEGRLRPGWHERLYEDTAGHAHLYALGSGALHAGMDFPTMTRKRFDRGPFGSFYRPVLDYVNSRIGVREELKRIAEAGNARRDDDEFLELERLSLIERVRRGEAPSEIVRVGANLHRTFINQL